MIHDIGKIGIPDAILSKPDRLTPRERSIIEQHPLIAVRILEKMSFLEQEVAIVRGHHEKYQRLVRHTIVPVCMWRTGARAASGTGRDFGVGSRGGDIIRVGAAECLVRRALRGAAAVQPDAAHDARAHRPIRQDR